MAGSEACWCGNRDLLPFSDAYRRCPNCETLLAARMPDEASLRVKDDERDFYGRRYFEEYAAARGFPTLRQRARLDLAERCLHWLRAVLAYRPPPAAALDAGCAHGGFVALLRWAGYDATGLDLSPATNQFARAAFGVPVLTGPLEEQNIPEGSLDVVAVLDVLEHLPDVPGFLQRVAAVLRPGGVLLIQTPCYPEGASLAGLESRQHRFLDHLHADEHLHLFSKTAVRKLCAAAGLPQVLFLDPFFAHYDLFAVAGAGELRETSPEEIVRRLTASPSGRLIDALLQKDDALRLATSHHSRETADLHARLEAAEADRAARLEVIEQQGRRLGEIEAQRNNLQFALDDLRRHYEASEADRAARLQVIEEQGRRLGEIEAQRNNLQFALDDLRRHYEASEADRAARLEVIEQQGRRLGEIEAQRNNLQFALEDLRHHYDASEADRAARLEVIEEQGRRLGALESETAALRTRLDQAMANLAALRERFERLSASRLYRFLRRAGCWKWLDLDA